MIQIRPEQSGDAASVFPPASRSVLACQWEGVPDGAFMALILDKAVMAGVSGVARYRVEFDAVR